MEFPENRPISRSDSAADSLAGRPAVAGNVSGESEWARARVERELRAFQGRPNGRIEPRHRGLSRGNQALGLADKQTSQRGRPTSDVTRRGGWEEGLLALAPDAPRMRVRRER